MTRRAIGADKYHVPARGFTPAIAVQANNDLVFVSGVTARSAEGQMIVSSDYGRQTRQILDNLETILGDAGCTLDDVVQIHVYMLDIAQWPVVQAIFEGSWGDVFPASTAVQVVRLFDQSQLIEIDAIARVGPKRE